MNFAEIYKMAPEERIEQSLILVRKGLNTLTATKAISPGFINFWIERPGESPQKVDSRHFSALAEKFVQGLAEKL